MSRKKSKPKKPQWQVYAYSLLIVLFVIVVIVLNTGSSKPPAPVKDIPFREDATLSFIRDGDLLDTITIEIVEKPAEIQRGLMFRESMREDRGMLFIFPQSKVQSFWMRNTHIPLDIIFINGAREILKIARHTKPLTDTPIVCERPAKYVLEVNAGFAEEYDIQPGDRISWELTDMNRTIPGKE